MWIKVFIALLVICWLITVMTVFCPLRAWRRRLEREDAEESRLIDPGQG